jgi:hypothetical protein
MVAMTTALPCFKLSYKTSLFLSIWFSFNPRYYGVLKKILDEGKILFRINSHSSMGSITQPLSDGKIQVETGVRTDMDLNQRWAVESKQIYPHVFF